MIFKAKMRRKICTIIFQSMSEFIRNFQDKFTENLTV
jgi:hypothetical protein